MPKNTIYSCTNCGAQYPKWQGRCQECGQWGGLTEEIEPSQNTTKRLPAKKPVDFKNINLSPESRLKTTLQEWDQVLGGGLVAGSVVLLGGDPGIGKSTLALQLASQIKKTLYISGEESASQIKMRAQRLATDLNQLQFLNETDVDIICSSLEKIHPPLAIIDSIQTIRNPETPMGSASQITAATAKLVEIAKKTNIPIIIIGHVTKEGVVAGPKTIEHLVDTVLYFETDNQHHYRLLRSIKNRFGPTGEIGLFEMTGQGLKEITNASQAFWQKTEQKKIGIIPSIVMEGSRAFIVEIQALTAKTSFGYPQRKAIGFDQNRLQMIIAVLAKTAKINLANQDIYLNVAGGMKIKETAIDLAVALAVTSSLYDLPWSQDQLALGEIGLAGEIRPVSQADKRIKEASKNGFNKIIINNTKQNSAIISIQHIKESLTLLKQK